MGPEYLVLFTALRFLTSSSRASSSCVTHRAHQEPVMSGLIHVCRGRKTVPQEGRGASLCARHAKGFFVMVTTCRERAFSSSVLAASARSSSCVSGFTSAAGPLFVRRLAICAQEQLFVGHQCLIRQPLP